MRRSGPKMRLTHQRMAGRLDHTPESVLDWLEEQLECRGIDAVVYTRYILSLLQDYDTDDELSVDTMPSMGRRSFRRTNGGGGLKDNLKPVTTNKFKHKRYLNSAKNTAFDDHFGHNPMNSDEERKLAVVQCLKSASEQEIGIESFVDELCAKLKNIKVLSESGSDISVDTSVETNISAKVSPKEQAQKYYAAFPALDNNSNEDKKCVTSKPTAGVVLTRDFNQNSVTKWNGQKIIEFITSANITNEELDAKTSEPNRDTEPDRNSKPTLDPIKADDRNTDIKLENGLKLGKNLIYCEDIENNVLIGDNGSDGTATADNACPLVVDNSTADKRSALRVISEDNEVNDRFERLVNKFNSNIASIWSTAGADAVASKTLDNIWSFDSSFSSNQSSATPSPKQLAIDFWSSLGVSELSQVLADKRADPPMPSLTDCWSSSLLHSYNMFPDDGFIDGNHDLIDDESNWTHLTIDHTKAEEEECNRTTLENHQKNSPFVEVKSGTYAETESQSLSKLLAAVLQQSSAQPPSPSLSEENLLTSSRTHFQPIRHEPYERDSDDDSVDITDTEVNKLVICSDKCPNNADVVVEDTAARLHLRPLTTSYGELSSFMGPFNDTQKDLFGNEDIRDSQEIMVSKMSDKSTNTEIVDAMMTAKTRLSLIEESTVESEPEYQDLYDMINEVLRNGISEDDSPLGSSLTRMADEWYESDGGTEQVADHEVLYGANRQKRLSWNYYLDTYECPIGSTDRRSPVQPLSDEVFDEELLYTEDNNNNEDYEDYEQTFGDYFQSADDNHSYDMSGYPLSDSQLIGEEVAFGPQLGLQFKSRHNQAVKRKPCSFFIEGNCKRSDCKYSHDISAITCKYWEEGFCFKAEMCPFLHGYRHSEDKGRIRRDCSPLTALTSGSYYIESESDFPALSTNGLTSEEGGDLWLSEPEPVFDVEQHLLEIKAKSMAEQKAHHNNTPFAPTVPLSKAKLPIAVFMKKKVKKRKDRNLQ